MKYKEMLPEFTIKYKTGKIKKVKFEASYKIVDFFRELYDQDTIECTETVIVIFCNHNLETIGWFKLSYGGIKEAIFDIKMIMAISANCMATGIILSHNHPSGNVKPSKNDIKMTYNCEKALEYIDTKLLDHIIVSNEHYYSFFDERKLTWI